MDELEKILEREVRELACGVLGHPQGFTLDDTSNSSGADALRAASNTCSHARFERALRYRREVANCCRARSCEQFFNPNVARRSLETYRKKGLDRLERKMIASVSAGALDGMQVLEIGGGIGRIQAELLAAGADRGEVVELVAAYEPYARELARETGLEGRTSFRIVDILEEPDAVEPADIVVLNRVVCCSPDGVGLASAAARLARRTLVVSFPRDVVWVRAGIKL